MVGIRSIEQSLDKDGRIGKLRVLFGPHYFLEVECERGGKGTLFRLGATHHGFQARADSLNGELERMIEFVREHHPEATID